MGHPGAPDGDLECVPRTSRAAGAAGRRPVPATRTGLPAYLYVKLMGWAVNRPGTTGGNPRTPRGNVVALKRRVAIVQTLLPGHLGHELQQRTDKDRRRLRSRSRQPDFACGVSPYVCAGDDGA